jgi:zinc-ribbon domain
MADFVESAKNFVSAAVSRTSWEAQKQMRVRGKQSEIDKLVDKRRQLLDELAQITMNLYQQGTLPDPQLAGVCANILQVDADVRGRDAQLQDIKKEVFVGDQAGPAAGTTYSAPAFTPPSSTAQPPRPGQPQAQICPNCGSPVRPNALYCRSCGGKLR